MAEMLLTIQHNGTVFSPPVEEGVQIEWERTGTPGKLTFTTVTPSSGSLVFTEGDPVCFYYDNKPVFMGYVFTKKHDRERKIQVTCYDQIRYLKNKFSYVFENKTAAQIVKALCADFNLQTGEMDDTNYVIPAIAEENKSALDIVLNVLEETLLNTGDMFVLYDDFGKLRLRNAANMMSLNLVYSESAENFDFSSSIDNETYNQIVLYYKQNDKITQMYTAHSPSTIKQWGTLRYFEEVKTPTIGQNKANALLKLYNRKTRELKVTGAFGDISVRGGTLIPVQLELGEVLANNFMLVEKVTHKFDKDHHTMDLTLQGAWDDKTTDMVSQTIGELVKESTDNGSSGGRKTQTSDNSTDQGKCLVTIKQTGQKSTSKGSIIANDKRGKILVEYYVDGKRKGMSLRNDNTPTQIGCDLNSTLVMKVTPGKEYDAYVGINKTRTYKYVVTANGVGFTSGSIEGNYSSRGYTFKVTKSCSITVDWKSVYTEDN